MIKRIGVIGGGQLAWMMADAAQKLALELVVQTPSKADPAVAITNRVVLGAIADAEATANLATQCDVITFENEFVDLPALSRLATAGVCFRPGLASLAPLLDKYSQHCYLRNLNLPVPEFIELNEFTSNFTLPESLHFPLVAKARRHGYDGQGTQIIHDSAALMQCWQQWGRSLLLEEWIPFERELAVMAARSASGEMVIYPVVETQQENQICRRVLVTNELPSPVVAHATAIAQTLLAELNYIGILGIEFFLTKAGKLLINEIAPRTHNSGHYTLDACHTSQFEQQLRAIADLPLGDPSLQTTGAVMVNLLGYEHSVDSYTAKRHQLAQLPHSTVHWYGKRESHPGRKLGHVTVLVEPATRSQALAIAQTIETIWYDRQDQD